MFAAVFIAHFGLQVRLGAEPALRGRPVALLEEAGGVLTTKQRGRVPVREANAEAVAAGVRVGQTASQALARCSGLALRPREVAAERAAQAGLLEAMAGGTPDFEDTAPGLVIGDFFHQHHRVSGRRLGADLRLAVAQRGLVAQVGLGPTPGLAALAARLATEPECLRIVPDNEEARRGFLGPLPLEVLSLDHAALHTFHLWGIRTLGGLAALPRLELVRRLGLEAGVWWDQATGRHRRLLRLVRCPVTFGQTHELDTPVETLEPLLFLLRRMLETLCARLEAAWRVAAVMRLSLRFDNATTHTRDLRLAEPSRDLELMARLLHAHLDTLTAEAPVVFLALEIGPTKAGSHQRDLFVPGLRDPGRFAATLAQLEAVLGPGRVGTPALLPTRRLDGFVLEPFGTAMTPALSSVSPGLSGPPLRRLRPPVRARVRMDAGRPVEIEAGVFQGPVLACRGPWRLSGEWWDAGARWGWQEWIVDLAHTSCRLAHHANGNWEIIGVHD